MAFDPPVWLNTIAPPIIGASVVLFVQRIRHVQRELAKYRSSSPISPPVKTEFVLQLVSYETDAKSANNRLLAVTQLVAYRYAHLANTLDPNFRQTILTTLSQLPDAVLAVIERTQTRIMLDAVGDGPAITLVETSPPVITVNQRFVLDDTIHNALRPMPSWLFPYGLDGILIHEIGHILDYHAKPSGSGPLSATPDFRKVYQHCVEAIPSHKRFTPDDLNRLCEHYKGQSRIPKKHWPHVEMALYWGEPEEVFAECVVWLLTGRARSVASEYYSDCFPVVAQLLLHALQSNPSEATSTDR